MGDRFICGSAKHFRVGRPSDGHHYINGHMPKGGELWWANPAGCRSNVLEFHRDVCREIVKRGGTVTCVSSDPRDPDDIYEADTMIAFTNTSGKKIALISKMRHKQRQREVVNARRTARRMGFMTVESDCVREGNGNTLFDPNFGIWWVGVGLRGDPRGGKQLSALSGCPSIEVPANDPYFYHLDVFLSFLPNGHVVVYKDAMTPLAYEALCAFYPDNKRLEIDRETALAFGANLQFVTENNAHHVFVPKECPDSMKRKLTEWGYKIIEVRGIKRGVGLGGGATHCSFQKVLDLRKYANKPLSRETSDIFRRIAAGSENLPEKLKMRVYTDQGKLFLPKPANSNSRQALVA